MLDAGSLAHPPLPLPLPLGWEARVESGWVSGLTDGPLTGPSSEEKAERTTMIPFGYGPMLCLWESQWKVIGPSNGGNAHSVSCNCIRWDGLWWVTYCAPDCNLQEHLLGLYIVYYGLCTRTAAHQAMFVAVCTHPAVGRRTVPLRRDRPWRTSTETCLYARQQEYTLTQTGSFQQPEYVSQRQLSVVQGCDR
ncbi:hypothetical protein GQ44DRAFT_402094 [Phaeosphaeriaceae sp. PMI808]|nr:hypothetical protein GQ44DRAFT_402094 [Phaeosphaeriaceae sp. PMI808]